MSTPTSLAQVTVQADALSVVKDIEDSVTEAEDFWVSCYETGKPSVHGKVRVAIDEKARDRCAFNGREGVECQQVAKNTLHISCHSLHISSRTIRFPSRRTSPPSPPTHSTSPKLDLGIASLDVAPDRQIWVAGLRNGSVVLGKKGEGSVVGPVHKASVSSVKLLPDSVLGANLWKVLSASDDFAVSLSSFSTSPRSNSAILRLRSHTRAVTSLSLLPSVDSQAISGGKDGTLRIWDLDPGEGKQLGMLRSSGDVAITAISVSGSGGIVAMALQSGHFDLVNIDTRTTIFSSSSSSSIKAHGALDAIALCTISEPDGRHLLATGSGNGVLSFYICAVRDGGVDVRSIGACIRNGAGVSDIKLVASSNGNYPTVLVATTDGLPYQLRLTPTPGFDSVEFEVEAEYAGRVDCSPIRSIVGCVESREVWMAGDDGMVWVYEL